MNAITQPDFTVEEFLGWAQGRPGRYELIGGKVVAQAAERVAHAVVKGELFVALRDAVRRADASCQALPDGVAVKIGKNTVYEPDAQVYCGPKLPPDARLVENPTVVVEVLSPSTGRNDASRKLVGYLSLASVMHYLIVDPDEPVIIHHRRAEKGVILTEVLRDGEVVLDPPGLRFELSEIYTAA